ncbi:MAG: type III glutamate--ammonia ligase [Burkholderiales bacterium]|nr:type III glutamate--ammonia ligase [Burkholderiales bacterium]MDE1925862.1 type III glutamate--ammonia ligase [Burkholderiales bacterium]MDE2503073.1 type III glutamate--ammonia ligase [Burkholderiales bacterium]
MTNSSARQFFEERHIRYVLAQFVDIHGVAKTKSVPADHYDEVLKTGAGFAGGAIWGMGIAPNGPDYMAVGDPATLSAVPWQPGYARVVCDGHTNGEPHDHCSRVVLKHQLERVAARGWTFYTGLEPEFSLLKKTAEGKIVPCDPGDTLIKPCYDYKGLSRVRTFLERLSDGLREVGIDVYQIDHEDANGQFEINYTYADALTSCDQYVFFKMAASEIANDLGLICSFMPKPFSNRPGNGLHFHMSMGQARRNLFEDKGDRRGMALSELGYQFMGGLMRHAAALTALCCPSVNSYKRLVVGRSLTGATWAPAYISYGLNNRSSFVRGPGGRIELRLPDGGCNPYLATAAVIAAGLDGIDNRLDPGEPNNDNLYDYSEQQLRDHGIGILPQNLAQALDALEADATLMQALGPVAVEFIRLKRMEWIEYMRHVSDWEISTYLEFY